MFDFIAIDFETATGNLNSACSLGIVAVKDLTIADSFYSLIQPPKNKYDNSNIAVHHITPSMTADAPTLTELWPKIIRFFDIHVPVVAHNAHFDMSVLRLSTDVIIPDFSYVDSINIVEPYIEGSKSLANCAEELGISYGVLHNAKDDAELCAQLVIEAMRKRDCLSLWEYVAKSYLVSNLFSELKPQKYLGKKKKQTFESVDPRDIQQTVEHIDPHNPLCGMAIVFTGQLSIPREEAMQLAVNCGAIIKSSVSRKTNYLVVGTQDKSLVGDDGLSTKEELAYKYNSLGKADIKFLSEDDFITLAKGEILV